MPVRFTGEVGTSWQSVDHVGRWFVPWVPAAGAMLYSTSPFAEYEIATGTRSDLGRAPSALWGVSGATLLGDAIWGISPPVILRYDIGSGAWTTVRVDLGWDVDAMTVADDAGAIWGYQHGDVLLRFEPMTGALDRIPTGVSAASETRLAYDASTDSIYFAPALGASLFRFDIGTGAVTVLASHPEGVHGAMFCGDRSGHLYTGGLCEGTSAYQYDIATDTWTPIPDRPRAGCRGSCSVHGDGWLYIEELGWTSRLPLL